MQAEFIGMTTRELIDDIEWKANIERINKGSKRFILKGNLHPAPWIVKKEFLDRLGVYEMKGHKLLDTQFENLKKGGKWD